MAEYIEREALWTDIMMLPHNGDIISSEDVEQAIKDTPAADVAPVVRCGSCANRPKDAEYGMCRVWWQITHKDEYCSRADAGSDGADG